MSASSDHLPRGALPTLRQLQFLTALHTHGGFVRAAEAVGVTQPTLSAGVKELEVLLGAVLVDRSRPGAHLTPAGEEAVARAQRALGEVEELVRAVRGAGAPMTGPFRLGAIPTIAPFLLPQALPALKRRFPLVQLYLREEVTARLIEALRARTLDAALIALPYAAPGIDTLPILDDEFLLAAPVDHPLSKAQTLDAEDVRPDELLLLEDGHCLREHALSGCGLSMGRRGQELSATSLYTLVQMAAGGMGVTLLPKLAHRGGAAAGANVAVRPFSKPMIGRTIAIAWRAGGPRAEEARMIAETLAEMEQRPKR
jgi:LysR family hydrogen peroxide-inducible transcriptional activator